MQSSSVHVTLRNKSRLQGFWRSKFQTSFLKHQRYKDKPEYQIFACSMFRDDSFQKPNNKGADQTAQMRRLVCAFVVRKPPRCEANMLHIKI